MRVIHVLAPVAIVAFAFSCTNTQKKAGTAVTPTVTNSTATATVDAASGTDYGGGWSDGQSALLRATDLEGASKHASPQKMWSGDSAKATFRDCDGGDPLVEEIASNGPHIALGSEFGQGAANVLGGLGISSLAFQSDDDAAASRTQALLSSTVFWDCITDHSVNAAQGHAQFARNAGTTLLPSLNQGAAIQTIIEATTTDPSHTPYTNYSDWVVVRAGNNLAVLLLNSNDGPFPEDLRAKLTAVTAQRLQGVPHN